MTDGIGSSHRQRLAALLTGLFALALPPTEAAALSLGEPNVHSSLNQPFNAAIPVELDSGESLAKLHINGKLSADPAGNSEANNPALHLTLERRGNSGFIVHVNSDEAVQATSVKLKLTISSEQGQTSREYSVLMDPAHSLTGLAAVSTDAAAAVENSRPATQFGPVAVRETLWSIAGAIDSYPDISQAQMALALYQANPHAFYQPTINALKSGEFLSIPAHDEIARIPPEQAKRQVKAELAQFREVHNAPSSGIEPAQQEAAPATPAVETGREQAASATLESAPIPPEAALPPSLPAPEISSPVDNATEKTASAAALPEKITEPAENDTAPSNTIRMISAAALAVLLSLAIRSYLEYRSRKQALEAERQARQAQVTRELLKEKMLADIRYPQKQASPDLARTTEMPISKLTLLDTQADSVQTQTDTAPAISPAPAQSPGLSLLPLEDAPNVANGHNAVRAAPTPVAEENAAGSLTAAASGNISAVISDLTDMDENETKLDLALTYTAMGDSKSAANLLAEVIAEGSDTQQAEARKQLETLG
jgi:pilus assembly protein FimV